MAEMPILRALRRLVTQQFIKPEWVIWERDPESGWEFKPDGFAGNQSFAIDFNGSGGNVQITIDDDVKEVFFKIPWADPECDIKVAKMLNDWLVKMWEENYLEKAGYPNPTSGVIGRDS